MRRLLPILLAALALGACGDDDGGGGGGGAEPDARELLQRGFATDVDSGRISLEMSAELRGGNAPGGPLELRVSGPFQNHGPRRMPSFDLEIDFSGGGQRVEAGLIFQRQNAYVEYDGEAYEVGEDVWRQFLRESGEGQGPSSLGQLGLEPNEWIANPRVEGEAEVGGVQTTEVSGAYDVTAMLSDLNAYVKKLPDMPALTDAQIDEIAGVVEDAELHAWIDDQDIWRRVTSRFSFELPADVRRELGGLESGEIDIDLRLAQPNERQRISTPDDTRPITSLLRELGIPPEALLGPGARAPEPG